MDAPAFDAIRFVRPALRSIVFCFSIIVISLMTMLKPAHATGNVPPVFLSCSNYLYQNAWSGYERGGFSTAAAACAIANQSVGAYTFNGSYFCTGSNYYRALCISPVFSCPANSTGSTTCTCNAGYQPDSTGTSCLPVSTCPVKPLTTPPFSDACSTSLERGHGVDVNNKCTLREPDMAAAASCIADKIHKALGYNVYTVPSSTIRTVAYQDHLLEIWTKSQRLDTIMNSVVFLPEIKQACVPVNVDVGNEKVQHGITHQPSSSGDAAPHVQHRAIDVPEAVANALMDQVTTYTTTTNSTGDVTTTITGDVEDYMHSATDNPPACDPNLSWGGRFKKPKRDPVHFQLP
jgi:hypothetical protein